MTLGAYAAVGGHSNSSASGGSGCGGDIPLRPLGGPRNAAGRGGGSGVASPSGAGGFGKEHVGSIDLESAGVEMTDEQVRCGEGVERSAVIARGFPPPILITARGSTLHPT
jgi:hypothetical protein